MIFLTPSLYWLNAIKFCFRLRTFVTSHRCDVTLQGKPSVSRDLQSDRSLQFFCENAKNITAKSKLNIQKLTGKMSISFYRKLLKSKTFLETRVVCVSTSVYTYFE